MCAYLDIEVLWVIKHGTDVLRLLLHVYLLDLSFLFIVCSITVGRLDLVLSESGGESGFGCLKSGPWERGCGSHIDKWGMLRMLRRVVKGKCL